MATSLSDFRTRFPEFASIADVVITLALNDAADLMEVVIWDTKYDTGQAFLAAHFVKLSSDASGGASAAVGPISQAATGPIAVTYAVTASSNVGDDMLRSTTYGQRYIQLRDLVGLQGLTV